MIRKKILILILLMLFCLNLSITECKAITSIPQNADLSINGINLCDPKGADKNINKEIILNSSQDLPYAEFYNKNKTQILILIFFPGDIKNNFCRFKIKNDDKKRPEIRSLEHVKDFISGKNIRLGITKNKLIKILGEQFTSEIRDGIFVIRYKIDNLSDSEFLKTYNLPSYSSEYKFQNNKLIEFTFGFEYP